MASLQIGGHGFQFTWSLSGDIHKRLYHVLGRETLGTYLECLVIAYCVHWLAVLTWRAIQFEFSARHAAMKPKLPRLLNLQADNRQQ